VGLDKPEIEGCRRECKAVPVQGKREDKRKAQEGRGDTTERRTVSSGRDATGMVACRWHDDDCVSLRHGAATAAKPADREA
jgi:hypothetical protein